MSRQESTPFRCGFAALCGAANVGKSTLLNRLLGKPLALVTPKPQTTRSRLRGVLHGASYQAILVDTPGLHRPRKLLGQRMVSQSLQAAREADVLLFMVKAQPADKPVPAVNDLKAWQEVQDQQKRRSTPVLLLINRIDGLPPAGVLRSIDRYQHLGDFAEIFPLSALKGYGCEALSTALPRYLPCGPPLYDAETISDQSLEQRVGETIRGAILLATAQEVPHATAIEVESCQQSGPRLEIFARIHVESTSQRGILIGKGGSMLERIGSQARRRLQAQLERPVFLRLHVQVLKNWRRDPRRLDALGYAHRN